MGCVVTFHHRIGQERLTTAIAPQAWDAFHALLESALAETAEAAACRIAPVWFVPGLCLTNSPR